MIMNETLIRQLVEQNERIANLYNIGPVQRAEVEQFVEAIVKEAIEKIESNYVAMVGTYPGAHNSAIRKCVVTVKEHFGVEE